MAEIDYGPGCPRHVGDPHNLCPECWKLEPTRSGPTSEQAPTYDTDVVWSWNTRISEGAIEVNLHDAEKTVVITADDLRRMTNALRLGFVVA